VEALLSAESAFKFKSFTEVKTRDVLKEVLEDIELMEQMINAALTEN